MKSNIVIAGCLLSLAGLATALIIMTLSPSAALVSVTSAASYNWYYKPTTDGSQPIVADDADFLSGYDALYLGNAEDKVIYLTFDAGYENGYTDDILDVLREKGVSAAFFVTGHYIDSAPELVKRMVAEGHLVCNHTVTHKDLSETTSLSVFEEELDDLCEKFLALTGEEMPKYVRPPSGKYSESFLQISSEMGYVSVFWSFAYKDWLNDEQPDPQASLELILSRTHPGEVALLHANSSTNAAILGELIDAWRADGYTFKTLDDLRLEVLGY